MLDRVWSAGRLTVGLSVLAAAAGLPRLAAAVTGPPARAQGAARTQATGPPCGPRAARTLAADAVARVYAAGGDAYGCAVWGARAFALGATGFSVRSGRVEPIRVSGTVAAYGLVRSGVDTAGATVVVRRLTTGRVLSQSAATTTVGVEGFQSVDSLVIKPDGAVAWIATANSIGPPKFVRQLRRVDRRGTVTLDSGPAVGAISLRLRGVVLSWRHAGSLRTSTLR